MKHPLMATVGQRELSEVDFWAGQCGCSYAYDHLPVDRQQLTLYTFPCH